MKTAQLIELLATDADPIAPRIWRVRYAIALAVGLVGAFALMLLLLGPRPDLVEATRLPMFWIKLAYPLSIAMAALVAVTRLSRPGVRPGQVVLALVAPVLVIWLMAAWALTIAAPDERVAMLLGDTWKTCPVYVTILSLPAFIGLLWVLKSLAPTQLALAGAAAGLLAGALAASVYALHCPEMEASFLGIWYLLGMLIPTTLGAMIGPRLLRW